jgi:uncharacterized repeat protein (TIGR04138 family)
VSEPEIRLNFDFEGLTVLQEPSGFGIRGSLPIVECCGLLSMKKQNFTEMVNLIIKEDDRFTKEAYSFLKEALDFTMDKERKRKRKIVTQNQRHVTGQELLEGAREFALDQYGPMAFTVLTSWGLKKCEDIGEMVFNLIEYGVFSRNEDDSKEDFTAIYSFEEAFQKPFQPEKRRLKRPSYRAIESL